jgi:hypothetical protein
MVSTLLRFLGLLDQFYEGEHFCFRGPFKSLFPLIRLKLFSKEIFYQKMGEPAIENFETRQAFVLITAVGKGDLVAQPRAANLIVFPRGGALSSHGFLSGKRTGGRV